MKVTEHVSYREVIKSNTAIRRGIENIPSGEQMERIKLLCEKVFEPPMALFNSTLLNKLFIAIGPPTCSLSGSNLSLIHI